MTGGQVSVRLTPDELDLAEQLTLSLLIRKAIPSDVTSTPRDAPPVTDVERDALVRALAGFDDTSRTHGQMCPYHRKAKLTRMQPVLDVVEQCNCWRLGQLRNIVRHIIAAGWGPR